MIAVMTAVLVVSGGWHADAGFCQGAMKVIAALYVFFIHGVLWPLIILVCWRAFTDAASPYPLMVALVLVNLVYMFVHGLILDFWIEHMPLEIYHLPKWILKDLRISYYPNFPMKHKLEEAALRAAAERRASKLRAQMGLAADAAQKHVGQDVEA